MTKNSTYILLVTICACTLIVLYILYDKNSGNKIGWVDLNKVYNEFELKKELEGKLEITRQSRKKILDSLEFEIMLLEKSSGGTVNQNLIQNKKEYYIKKKRMLDMDDENVKSEYQSQILKQMNQFIKDYGEKNKYHYVMGADGSGTLMYANKDFDITDKVKEYVNERFKGMQK